MPKIKKSHWSNSILQYSTTVHVEFGTVYRLQSDRIDR